MINIPHSQKTSGIYKITSPMGRIYIGQSINIKIRWDDYKKLKCKGQPKLYRSLLKYGWENHIFEIIEECPENYLDEMEMWWKHYYGVRCVENGLNHQYIDGRGGRKSEETKGKMRLMKNKKGKHHSDASKLKMSKNSWIKGKKQSDFQKQQVSKSRSGRKMDDSSKLKISISKKGRKDTEETKLKKSLAHRSKYKPKPNNFNSKQNKPILQYDLDDVFLKEWKSIKEAELFYYNQQNDMIGKSCREKGKIVLKKYKFYFKNEYNSNPR